MLFWMESFEKEVENHNRPADREHHLVIGNKSSLYTRKAGHMEEAKPACWLQNPLTHSNAWLKYFKRFVVYKSEFSPAMQASAYHTTIVVVVIRIRFIKVISNMVDA